MSATEQQPVMTIPVSMRKVWRSEVRLEEVIACLEQLIPCLEEQMQRAKARLEELRQTKESGAEE